jgi:hypothetical protein
MATKWVGNPQCGWLGCLTDHSIATEHTYDSEMQEQIELSRQICRELDAEERAQ